jgi:hypothetical protein
MRAISKKGLKRRIVSLAATIATLGVYIPFMDARWTIFVAMCVGYTILALGLAWSDGKLPQLYSGNGRSLSEVIRAHLLFLSLVIGWIWFVQYIKLSLPDWIAVEGSDHISWFLVFALLGIVALLIAELSWLSTKPKSDLLDPHNSSQLR